MPLAAVVETSGRVLRWRGLSIDLQNRSIGAAGSPLRVSPAEFGVLDLLLRRRNLPLSKEAILLELFGPGHGRDERQADVFVARLRRVLAGVGLGEAVATVPGRGYAILDDSELDDGMGRAGQGPRVQQVLLAA